jgi:hypothetical protein
LFYGSIAVFALILNSKARDGINFTIVTSNNFKNICGGFGIFMQVDPLFS